MSYISEPGICYCQCHDRFGFAAIHSVACCEGPCPVCRRNVKRGSTHVKECRQRIEDLAAGIED